MSCNSCVTWLLYLCCQLKRDDEEGHEAEEEEVTAHDMPPSPKPTRRVSNRETDLVTQLEAVLAGREEDRQARLALERQVQQLMAERGGREDISGSNTKLYPSTPAVSASYVHNGGSSTDCNRMPASNIVRQRYLDLRELHDELLLADENARLRKI